MLGDRHMRGRRVLATKVFLATKLVMAVAAGCLLLAGVAGFWPDRALAQQQTTADTHLLSKEQLDQLVAPVALYPDSLLAQVLVASTYPLEIIEAARWADANKGLKGDQLAQALQDQTWDNSVRTTMSRAAR